MERAFEVIHAEDAKHEEEQQRDNEHVQDVRNAHYKWLYSQSQSFIPTDHSERTQHSQQSERLECLGLWVADSERYNREHDDDEVHHIPTIAQISVFMS